MGALRPSSNPLVDDTNRQIVQALANGQSPAQIARALPMNRQTVYTRLQRMRAALGASSTEQLVAIALRRRLIT